MESTKFTLASMETRNSREIRSSLHRLTRFLPLRPYTVFPSPLSSTVLHTSILPSHHLTPHYIISSTITSPHPYTHDASRSRPHSTLIPTATSFSYHHFWDTLPVHVPVPPPPPPPSLPINIHTPLTVRVPPPPHLYSLLPLLFRSFHR